MAKAKAPPKETEKDPVEGAEGEAPAKKKLAGKTLVLFVILPAILVLGAGGGAAVMLLSKGGASAEQASEEHGGGKAKSKSKGKDSHAKGGKGGKGGEGSEGGLSVMEGDGVYFVAMPEMLVNISSADGRSVYLKLKLTLEAADEEVVAALEPEIPRIMDQFQSFLRELRTDDMAGSAGAHRVRLELLRRVNLVIAPARINAVLIEEMLIQ